MPWKASGPMNERMRFIAEALTQEWSITVLCKRYGISRKTGYKLLACYETEGPAGLADRGHAPHRHPNAVEDEVVNAVLELRGRRPHWGPRKLRAWLGQRLPRRHWPAASTIGAILQRHGLTVPRRRRRCASASQPFLAAIAPNAVWDADFKGWFRTGDGRRCDPLTVSDSASRFLLRCQALPRLDEARVRPLFEAVFREYGLPQGLRTDNGPPFASLAAGGLSRLAVWWVKLGIRPERIAPGHPEQNGRHERLHRTLKQETANPPQATLGAQQRAFDRFRQVYNEERPHEALGDHPPGAVYRPSPRPYPERLQEPEYPADQEVRRVRHNGEIKWQGRLVFVSECLAGEPIGIEEIADGRWLLRFGPVVLGWLDARASKLRPMSQQLHCSFTPKVLPMCPV